MIKWVHIIQYKARKHNNGQLNGSKTIFQQRSGSSMDTVYSYSESTTQQLVCLLNQFTIY